jgi:hypothetical protein
MKRHKFPLLLIVVILTAVSITSFQQFRAPASTPKAPVTAQAEVRPHQSGPRQDSPAVPQGIRSATARVDLNTLTNDQKAVVIKTQDQSAVASSKNDGTY